MKQQALTAAAAATALTLLTACGTATDQQGVPDQLVWTTYGTGTSTYADVAAVANAVTSAGGPDIRVITSDTAVGRVSPVRGGQAQMSRTGDEYIFSFEGENEFANEQWGPQDVRVVWGPVAPHGLLVRENSGIETFEDLRGADFPRVIANPSVNNKLEAFLAYGGLTWDDVNPIEVDYGEQPTAMETGELDVLFHQVYGPDLYQLESVFDVRWLSMDDHSEERMEAVKEIAPMVEVGEFQGAAGQEEGEGDNSLIYSLPFMTYADTDEELVYEMVSAIHDTFDDYRDATANTHYWSIEESDTTPRAVPFHPGAVRFLKEQGEWSEEDQARNEELVERGEALRAGWDDFIEATGGGDVEELRPAWREWKRDNIDAPE